MNETRNILLFGRTGGGKSALANVLAGTDKFKESELGVSETRDIQVEQFQIGSVTYRMIDVIGVGDTKLSTEDVLFKLARIAEEVEYGINQILFVTGGRFTKAEISAYDLLIGVIFDKEAYKYTTVVRTNFTKFSNPNECSKDIELLKKENPVINKIDGSSIIHVNNPPLDVDSDGEERIALKNREKSREKLLCHLVGYQRIYRTENIDEINNRIQEHINQKKQEKEELEREIRELNEKLDKAKKDGNSEREELAKLVKEKQKEMVDLQARLEKDKKEFMAAQMKEHIEKKITLTDIMKAGTDMVVKGTETGIDAGSKVFPVAGPAVGGLLGAGIGTVAAFASLFVYA